MPDERTMIVTGASAGIGRALAVAAARERYRVVLVARRAEQLEDVARAIRFTNGACAVVVADVCEPAAAGRIVSSAVAAFSRLDVVVNNAGSGAFGALLEQSETAIDAQWQLHVMAPLRLSRIALPHLETTRGQLVFVGSGIARVPLPRYGAYAPVKAAIRAAATQLRRELQPRGIAVSYVDPGLVASEFHQAAGIERSTHVPASPPERVARAILRGISHRAAAINASPWQTAGTILGDLAGALADPTTSRLAAKRAASSGESATAPPQRVPPASFDSALEPIARRMERVKMPASFIRDALIPGTTLELNELAMRWAGMPNKNERAAMREVLDALTDDGYLESTGDETWKVLRAAD